MTQSLIQNIFYLKMNHQRKLQKKYRKISLRKQSHFNSLHLKLTIIFRRFAPQIQDHQIKSPQLKIYQITFKHKNL